MKCRTCGEEKEENKFPIRSDTGKRRTVCKKCRGKESREWQKSRPDLVRATSRRRYYRHREKEIKRSRVWNVKNPEAMLDGHLRRLYGITIDYFNAMKVAQNNVCAICYNPEIAIDNRTGKVRRLQVDHDHETLKVRGLLCTNCNFLVGRLEKSRNIQAAFAYINHHKSKTKQEI